MSKLDDAIAAIEKEHGKGSVQTLDSAALSGVEFIPTGCITLDLALGGGVPRGRIVEIYGPESSGKTTLATMVVAQAQREFPDAMCAYIDSEHAFDPVYAEALGVDVGRLLFSQPDTAEQALDIALRLTGSGEVPVIVVDSVAAMTPRAEIEGDMGDSHMGLQARLMGQGMRKIAGTVSKTDTTLIFINQLREKIGVMFGSPETTPGGRALKFYASVRIDIRRIESIKSGAEVVGNRTRVKVVKNKVAPPFKQAEFDILYGEGISIAGDVVDRAVEYGLFAKKGSWYTDVRTAEQLGQGREAVKQHLKDNPEYLDEVRADILGLIRG